MRFLTIGLSLLATKIIVRATPNEYPEGMWKERYLDLRCLVEYGYSFDCMREKGREMLLANV